MQGKKWTQVNASATFSPRRRHTAVVFDGAMWVIGGYDDWNLIESPDFVPTALSGTGSPLPQVFPHGGGIPPWCLTEQCGSSAVTITVTGMMVEKYQRHYMDTGQRFRRFFRTVGAYRRGV
ncbi:hypothetical protein CHS0354_030051 [Potamilus streckersoni]|uniref:Uncharacterized protein n=1 Tax=Potamilus streckersoni TaxID=2493646 RepID=A0AAE0RLK5_9BIVA|nr:hypothetical protein CHS0354_030051 [Potamilus streckersoni]